MTSSARGSVIGCSGFFAGAAVARMLRWSPLPKAMRVAGVAAVASMLAWGVLRPKHATEFVPQGIDKG